MDYGMDTKLSPTRAPLVDKPNSPPPTLKQIRRKPPFIRQVDSSEESPSPHDSIYEACLLTTSDDSSIPIEHFIPMVQVKEKNSRPTNDENERAAQDTDFRYGRGTILDTIIEKHSNGTMRSLIRSNLADNTSDIPFLAHRDSFVKARSPRRKHSFSMDDLQLIKQSYHEICYEIYASPKIPLRKPVERPRTPPGVPSWTAAQTAPSSFMQRGPRQFSVVPSRVQRFLGIERSDDTALPHVPYPDTVRAVSAPIALVSSRHAPRFRAPRSAYGPISRHPFNNAPIASVDQTEPPSKKVRFTPSATARDSAEMNLRDAMDSTVTSACHPMTPAVSMLPDAQPEASTAKYRICLHRRREKPPPPLNGNAINVQTAVNTQNSFITATAPLMSGGRSPDLFPIDSRPPIPVLGSRNVNVVLNERKIQAATKSERLPCWRCFYERCTRRVGHAWARASSCLCFVCCGYECDDNSMIYGDYSYGTGSSYFDQCTESRRNVLEQTPVSMV